jgi:BirA family transcriptional regulator, biotin operon repressor / biotin---[acetyl-CoA-carboxylase] ligase
MQLSPTLDVQAISRHLTSQSLGRRIDLHQRVASTNHEAVALGHAGAEHGTLVVADAQTAGRGRMARTWFSPPGLNIYASLLIRIPIEAARISTWLSWLPLIAALAAAEAIEALKPTGIGVKWPNDLLIGERKVGGILCESATASGIGPFQVIGVGLNVNGDRNKFPDELRDQATTLQDETGSVTDRNRLIAQWLDEMESCLHDFLARGPIGIAHAYRRRCTTIGKTVKAVLADGNAYVGLASGIDDDGSLTINERSRGTAAGAVRQVRAAEIIHLR